MQMFFWHLKHLYFDNTKPSELDWLLQVISTRKCRGSVVPAEVNSL